MTQSPLISIVMPNYNFGRYIGEAISSVMKQTYGHFELIIVDNGSTDNSRDVIRYWQAQDEDRIRPHFLKKKGLCFARNTALSLCRGEIITFLDSDDVWHKDFLFAIVEHFKKNPSSVAVYGNAEVFRSEGAQRLGGWFEEGGERTPMTGAITEALFTKGNFIPIDTVAIRRHVVDKAGKFDERFRLAEDLDFWMRVSWHFPFDYMDNEFCRIRRHDANASCLPSNAFQMLRVYRKNLALHPELGQLLGEDAINSRWYALYYEMGRRMLLLGHKKRARLFFRKALCCRRDVLTLRFWLYYPLSYCSFSKTVIRLRSVLAQARQ